MANVSKTPISRIITSSDTSEPKSRSRDEFKKQKELEEARKLGTEPAAVDEEGRDINPHIPQYISDAPWYVDPKGPTLKHQRPQEEKKELAALTDWYKKGVDTSKVATKYRKGACENCGAVTHKKRDCLERPRKIGAKYTGTDFAPDEYVQPDLNMGFDGKRDRWNGYDPAAHQEVIEEFEKVEEVKKELKKEKLLTLDHSAPDPDDDAGAPSSDEDEDKYVDKMDMPGTKVDAAERYTVRNLRIREDTAKYLRNLDPNSAYYDPKTRAMRKNPYEATGKSETEVDYAGDNFVRISGDTVEHAKSQLFAWEAGSKGLDVHALAEPTKLEALKKEYKTKKEDFKDQAKSSIVEKYGGLEYLEQKPPRELIFSQTEDYVEYTRHGKIIKGEEIPVVRSRYEEDVYINNHTAIWGSFWCDGRWGFKCCHAMIKNSYCTGAKGKNAIENQVEEIAIASEKQKEQVSEKEEEGEEEEEKKEEKVEKKKKKKKKKKSKKSKKKKKKESSSESDSDSSDDDDFESKVAKAMKKQEAEEKRAKELLHLDERKRPYNSIKGGDDHKMMTEEEMEAYYRKRQRAEDPMASFLSKEDD